MEACSRSPREEGNTDARGQFAWDLARRFVQRTEAVAEVGGSGK